MSLKQPSPQLSPSEWFYPIDADSVPATGRTLHIQAAAENLDAIAERVGVINIKSVEASIHLQPQNGGHVLYISGHVKADIVQECITTLEPIDSHVEDDFEAWYADHDRALPFSRVKHQIKITEEGEEIQMLEEKDDPEPLINGQVDLGEVVIQFLSLAIDPYPRTTDMPSIDHAILTPEDSKTTTALHPNPFSALKNWRPKD